MTRVTCVSLSLCLGCLPAIAGGQTTATAKAGAAQAHASAVSPATEPGCSAAVFPAVERGFSRAVTRVGSPLASIRHRFAQWALVRATARAAACEAAATRQHTFSTAHGPAAPAPIAAEASCSLEHLPAVPAKIENPKSATQNP